MPIDGLVLQMKAMNIDNVVHFPFPTPPAPASLKVPPCCWSFLSIHWFPSLLTQQAAEVLLKRLGALDSDGRVTVLGRAMSKWALRYCFICFHLFISLLNFLFPSSNSICCAVP